MSVPFGHTIKLYIDGGAHDEKIVMRLFGIPAGVKLDEAELKNFLSRRSPGEPWETARREADKPVFECGVVNGATDGGEIRVILKNKNTDSASYSDVKRFPRPSHADYPALIKYGEAADLRGGGHFSGRLTALTCVSGFIAMQYLKMSGVEVFAHIYSVNGVADTPFSPTAPQKCPGAFPVLNENAGEQMRSAMLRAKADGDSLGGIIECAITGLSPGLGEHMFASVEAAISDAVFSVPAVKGVEFGAGFSGTRLTGSGFNDAYCFDGNTVKTYTNNNGGILGGMTDGMPVIFRAAIKPVPSIAKEQDTVDLVKRENARIRVPGRHDSCVVPRAVPVIEAAAALAAADIMLGETALPGLDAIRREIDRTDSDIVSLLNARMRLSRAAAVEKRGTGKAVYDPEREKWLLERIKAAAGENASLAAELYDIILEYSKKAQKAEN